MTLVLIEDDGCDALAPISTGRLVATITCGALRLIDIAIEATPSVYGISRSYLEPIQALDYPSLKVINELSTTDSKRPKLLLSARTAPTQASRQAIHSLLQDSSTTTKIIRDRGTIIAILNPPVSIVDLARIGQSGIQKFINTFDKHEACDVLLTAFVAPHEIIATNMTCLKDNLNQRLESHSYEQQKDGVFVGKNVSIGEYILFETGNGPIIIDDDAKIGPYSLLRGPLYVGKKCKILEHSAIKDYVSLGHTTKIGGEVEASVVEPYSNKQHHGFLGHSYLGSWINLGAGTCNSDLKNTYGTVNMEYPHGKFATGMQFLGCVMGDYSKTAINTGIFTGKVIGVCSMMYGFVTSNVPSFVNYARLFGQIAALPADVMIATQARMFARRNVTQRTCDIQLIQDMYRITQFERDNIPELV